MNKFVIVCSFIFEKIHKSPFCLLGERITWLTKVILKFIHLLGENIHSKRLNDTMGQVASLENLLDSVYNGVLILQIGWVASELLQFEIGKNT